MEQPEILVSVICNAYNHGPYIAAALDGFLMQQTDFPIEILVHDDASTDETAAVIRRYAARYPEKILPVFQEKNQYSQGVDINAAFQYPRVRGRYIAVCEGDDFWTDPRKLQRQVEAMEAHPEADLCAHAAALLNAVTGERIRAVAPRDRDGVIPPEEVIAGEGGFVATCSLLYRAELNREIPRFRRELPLDYALQIQGSLRGGMIYLAEEMSAYRYLVPGSWSARQQGALERRRRTLERRSRMLREVDRETQGRFAPVIRERILRSEFEFYYDEDLYAEAMGSAYRPFRRELGWKSALNLWLKAKVPPVRRLLEAKRQGRADA